MEVVERAVVSAAVPGTSRAFATFPALVVLAESSLLASYSIGTGKDTDDLTIELRRSTDGGRTWTEPVTPFETSVDGRRGSLKAAPITRLDGDQLIVAALWIDREAFPGQPLFNPATEGCLPMTVLLADSEDAGRTWTPWRVVPMPDDIGPPSLTNAVLRLADGRLVLSIESNKPYLDVSPWFQRVVHLRSADGGQTWTPPETICQDPTGRIANWDQRGAIAPDGRFVTFTWTYDFETASYRNIQRRISPDGVAPFGPPDDLGFADQPGHPAVLPDGRVVLAWVDRFGSASIRARSAAAVDAPFAAATEVVILRHGDGPTQPTGDGDTTGDALVEMGTWSYGLAYAEALPDGDVGVVHYAPGTTGGTDIRWARLRLDR
ncbi:MAG: sialidase family protein [Chloroflexota bacterium]